MFDNILGKAKFVEQLKLEGITDPKIIEDEWKKIERMFVAVCMENVYPLLTDEEKNSLTGELKVDSSEDLIEFATRFKDFLNSHPEKMTKEVFDKSLNQVYQKYADFMEKGDIQYGGRTV